jgi:hypothetical protein
VPDEDTPWYIQLLVCLGVMVGVAVLIGGVLAVFGVAAAHLVTFPSGSSTTTESAQIPTATVSPTSPSDQPSPSATTRSPRHHKHKSTHAITLTASPGHVSAYGRIDLTGSYLAPDGTSLQVQRREGGGWLDFPTTTTVNAGNFATYIETGHTGTNRFRVSDPRTGKVSNVVTVQVG